MLKALICTQFDYMARNACVIDVTNVKKCRPWPDAASETRRLLWVYTFCICLNVPFRMTPAISSTKPFAYQWLKSYISSCREFSPYDSSVYHILIFLISNQKITSYYSSPCIQHAIYIIRTFPALRNISPALNVVCSYSSKTHKFRQNFVETFLSIKQHRSGSDADKSASDQDPWCLILLSWSLTAREWV